jgi:hypothetical protein
MRQEIGLRVEGGCAVGVGAPIGAVGTQQMRVGRVTAVDSQDVQRLPRACRGSGISAKTWMSGRLGWLMAPLAVLHTHEGSLRRPLFLVSVLRTKWPCVQAESSVPG